MKIKEFLTNGQVYFPRMSAQYLLQNFGYSRGGLPHLSFSDGLYSISTRLYDSVPEDVVIKMKRELGILGMDSYSPAKMEQYRKLYSQIQDYEDQGYGRCFMRDPEIAELILRGIKAHDEKDYLLLAWSVMPNHIHLVLKLLGYCPLSPEENMRHLCDVIRSIKGSTARKANLVLGRVGEKFWQRDYFDRYIRDEQHLRNAVKYVINNPRKIGFTTEFTGMIFDDIL